MRPLNELLKDYPAIKAFPELVEAVRTRDTRIAELETVLRQFDKAADLLLDGVNISHKAWEKEGDAAPVATDDISGGIALLAQALIRARVLLTDQTPPVSFGEGETR